MLPTAEQLKERSSFWEAVGEYSENTDLIGYLLGGDRVDVQVVLVFDIDHPPHLEFNKWNNGAVVGNTGFNVTLTHEEGLDYMKKFPPR